MARPLLLDAFCGAGGAGYGYHLAGFDVVGVDHAFQPRYPFEFHQADALEFIRKYGCEFDAIHASPPCRAHSVTRSIWGKDYEDLIPATRAALTTADVSWVIENVGGAPIRADYILCGSQFGLRVHRHRHFETSWRGFELRVECRHVGLMAFEHRRERDYADAMECGWMTAREARQAIPPAYTEYLGEMLMLHLAENTRTAEEAKRGGGLMAVMDDFRVQLLRNKVVPNDDVFEAVDGLMDHARTAAASEGAERQYAYVEWLEVAAIAYMRAVYLSEKDASVKGDWGSAR